MASSAEDYPATSSAAQNLLKRLENRRDLTPEPLDLESNASTPIDSPQAPLDHRPQLAAQNLLKRLENRRDLTPEPLEPESNASTPVESPEVPLDHRSQVELSAKQRRCSHPPAMVKCFDDGLAYCRLCYACLTP